MRNGIAILAVGLCVAACGGRTPGNQHMLADGGADGDVALASEIQ